MALLPKIRCKNGYFYIRIKGKDYYLGKDPKEAKLKAQSLLIEHYLDKKSSSNKSDYKIRHVFALYLSFIKGTIEESSYNNLRTVFRKTIRINENCSVLNFTPEAFSSFLINLSSEGISKQRIKFYRNSILAAFKYAQTKNMLKSGTAFDLSSVPMPRTAKPVQKVKPPKKETFDSVIEKLPQVLQDILKLECLTGMRPTELLNLRKKDLSVVKNGVLRYEIVKHKTAKKTGEPLVKFIGPNAVEILNSYLEGKGPDEPLFYNSKGGVITAKYVSQTIWKLRQANPDLGRFHQYQCRHLAGTKARRIAGLDGAQAFLGHESASTSEIYSEVDNDLAMKIAEELG